MSETLSRRGLLQALGAGGVGLMLTRKAHARPFSSTGSYVVLPQKVPLIQLTERPVQLETPRHYFSTAITPNNAFFVRWHLSDHPRSVDLSTWRLSIEGHVKQKVSLSFDDLLKKFKPVSVTAVNQCSGNSRTRFVPAVQGSQWGHGAMGCAEFTGVRLRDVLQHVGVLDGALQVQFQGLDRGSGPEGFGSQQFLKSLPLNNPILDETILAYSMNGEPLPLLNGFPLRVVVPGYFSTYWVKALAWIRVLDKPDENYWTKTAYKIPDTPEGNTTPGVEIKKIPIGIMPVRSFIITPDGTSKIPVGFPLHLRGIAFGPKGLRKVEISTDKGTSWQEVKLGPNLGPYAFRVWEHTWIPPRAGSYILAVRATDGQGHTQTDEPYWNPGGYQWSRIEQQEIMVGENA